MFDPNILRPAFVVAALVTQLGVLVAGGAILGAELDERFGTGPWLLTVLTFAGFGAGIVQLVRGLQRLQEDDDRPPHDPP